MSIQPIKSAYERALKNERHDKVSETRYWCGQYRLMAEWAIDELERQANADLKKQALVAMQMDVIVGNLIREGINKHRARELAEHFIKHTQPKREWVGLTGMEKIYEDAFYQGVHEGSDKAMTFSRTEYFKTKKLQVTLQDRPIDIELAQYKRMFEAACSALGAVSDALGCDPDEGGAEPLLAAIKELKSNTQPKREPLTDGQIWDAVQHGVIGSIGFPSKAIAVARAIEAAHGIKDSK